MTQPAVIAPPALLAFERVHAVDEDGPRRRARGRLLGVDMAFGAGVHAILGAPEDGTIALSEVATGVRAPLRGSVRVRGLDPARWAPLRARIGALPPNPSLPPASTVAEQIRLAMAARGEAAERFDAVLDPFGLSALHARRPRTLTVAEERAVELALALSTPAPLLVVLHEPFADVAIPHPGLVRQRALELAEAGVCVLLVTSSPADARALADDIHLLHHGVLVAADTGDELPSASVGELTAWLREPPAESGQPGVRELAAALAARAEVRALSWDDTGASNGQRSSTLRLRGDVDACAAALAEVALSVDVMVDAISCTAPGLTQVRAARELGVKNLRPAGRAAMPELSPPMPAARFDALAPPPIEPAALPAPAPPGQGPASAPPGSAPPSGPLDHRAGGDS